MIERTIFSAEHEAFRDSMRRFIERARSRPTTRRGRSRATSTARSGARPAPGLAVHDDARGLRRRQRDRLFSIVQMESCPRRRSGIGSDCTRDRRAYLLRYGTEEQRRWLPRLASGRAIGTPSR